MRKKDKNITFAASVTLENSRVKERLKKQIKNLLIIQELQLRLNYKNFPAFEKTNEIIEVRDKGEELARMT